MVWANKIKSQFVLMCMCVWYLQYLRVCLHHCSKGLKLLMEKRGYKIMLTNLITNFTKAGCAPVDYCLRNLNFQLQHWNRHLEGPDGNFVIIFSILNNYSINSNILVDFTTWGKRSKGLAFGPPDGTAGCEAWTGGFTACPLAGARAGAGAAGGISACSGIP